MMLEMLKGKSKLDLTKLAVSAIVGGGTSKIVTQVVVNNTNPQNMKDQVQIAAGAVVLGAMAADASKSYTDAKIDSIVASWNELKAAMQKESNKNAKK